MIVNDFHSVYDWKITVMKQKNSKKIQNWIRKLFLHFFILLTLRMIIIMFPHQFYQFDFCTFNDLFCMGKLFFFNEGCDCVTLWTLKVTIFYKCMECTNVKCARIKIRSIDNPIQRYRQLIKFSVNKEGSFLVAMTRT